MNYSKQIIGRIIGPVQKPIRDRCSKNKEKQCKICGAYGDEHSIVNDVCDNCFKEGHDM